MSFKMRFWGVRGSYPSCGKNFETGGNTTCLEIEIDGLRLIFDAGTGIIKLGQLLSKQMYAAQKESLSLNLFFTHYHQDHTQGLPFFNPIYMPNCKIYSFGPKLNGRDLMENLNITMYNPFFPVNYEDTFSQKEFFNVHEADVVSYDLSKEPYIPTIAPKYIEVKKGVEPENVKVFITKNFLHPNGGSLCYRIEYKNKKVVFATDVEGYVGGDQKLIGFSKGADYLIHDTQYLPEVYTNPIFPTQGYGHSTPQISAEVAKKAGVKTLILTHHDPTAEDKSLRKIQTLARKYFKNSILAYEVMEVDVLEDKISQFTGF